MKIEYDFLFTDKILFLYYNKAKIVVKDGMLVAYNGKNGIETIPAANVAILMLGYGTSITQEAVLFCSKHNCIICFVRGGFNVHSMFIEGRYRDPKAIVNQVKLFEEKRLEIGKELLKLRLMINENKKDFNQKVDDITTIEELTGKEGVYVKNIYKKFCIQYKIDDFKKDNNKNNDRKPKNNREIKEEPNVIINRRLNILNNVLYSFCSVLCYTLSIEPSISIIHGKTRRGGFAFDLSDLIKTKVVLPLCFDLKKYEKEEILIAEFRNFLCRKNKKLVKMLIEILTEIKNGKMINAEKIYDSYCSK